MKHQGNESLLMPSHLESLIFSSTGEKQDCILSSIPWHHQLPHVVPVVDACLVLAVFPSTQKEIRRIFSFKRQLYPPPHLLLQNGKRMQAKRELCVFSAKHGLRNMYSCISFPLFHHMTYGRWFMTRHHAISSRLTFGTFDPTLDFPEKNTRLTHKQGGDLFDSIAEANKYSEKEASRMMHDLSNALSYLHSMHVCHRDIKPENLLVCDYSWLANHNINSSTAGDASDYSFKVLKLADFGLAIQLEPGSKLYDVCGTPNYVAPEILSESGYDHKVDVWAAGVIAFVLLCGFPPFVSPDNDQDELFDQILEGKFEFSSPAFDSVSRPAKQLITHMLTVDPEKRATASQVHSHPWISVSTCLRVRPGVGVSFLWFP